MRYQRATAYAHGYTEARAEASAALRTRSGRAYSLIGRQLLVALGAAGLVAISALLLSAAAMGAETVGTPVEQPGTVTGEVSFAHWLSGGELITSCNGNQLCAWGSSGPMAFAPEVTPLTAGEVAFSPDGTHIAYFEDTGGSYALRVADANGEHSQAYDPGVWISNCCLVWSDDSRTLYFQDSYGAINALSLETGAVASLTARGTWATVADQRNGLLLENDVNQSPTWEIYQQATSGGPMSDLQLQGYGMRFSPDGAQFAYASPTDSRVHVANADGTGDHAISPAGANAYGPVWSTTGETIAFTDQTAREVWTTRPDGTDQKPVHRVAEHEQIEGMAWASDDRSFAFATTNENNSEGHVYIAPVTEYAGPPPAVHAVTPRFGDVHGGGTVTITGEELGGAAAVYFGGHTATIRRDTTDEIEVTVPAVEAAGTVDVVVQSEAGKSEPSEADRYTYVSEPPPTVKKVGPKKGPADGGTLVTIEGANLEGVSQVMFGTNPGTAIHNVSKTEVTVLAPEGATGTVPVTLTTPEGTSPAGRASFKYERPIITDASPNHGPRGGGYTITVSGSGFALGSGTTAILFDKTASAQVDCASTTSCTVLVPASAQPGTVDLTAAVGKVKSKKNPAVAYYTYD